MSTQNRVNAHVDSKLAYFLFPTASKSMELSSARPILPSAKRFHKELPFSAATTEIAICAQQMYKFQGFYRVSSQIMQTLYASLIPNSDATFWAKCWSLQNETIASTAEKCPTSKQPLSNPSTWMTRHSFMFVLAVYVSGSGSTSSPI